MKKNNLRKAKSSDKEKLCNIWEAVFDKTDAALFFENYFNPELTIVAESDNIITAMGYLLPFGELMIPNEKPIPCGMIYGVGTLPEFRGLGYGSSISNELIKIARKSDYPAVVLCPADAGLFSFYGNQTQMREWFYISEYTLTEPFNEHTTIKPIDISIDEYLQYRDELLLSCPYIRLTRRAADYQLKLCKLYGGNLYMFKLPDGIACAIAEMESRDLIYLKELILPLALPIDDYADYIIQIASAISNKYNAKKCIIRTPLVDKEIIISNKKITRINKKFAMISLHSSKTCIENKYIAQPWYGPAFD